jgi:nitrous oxidase accessory protein
MMAAALLVALSVAGQIGAAEREPARSSLQTRIDRAVPGATIDVGPGTYEGDLVIDRPIRLRGTGWPRLVGGGADSVVRIRADDVTMEGFEIDGRGGGDLGRDSSGIHITGRRVVIRRCRIANTLFGIYLREAHDSVVEKCSIRGIPGKDAGEKGSGIHVWNTERFRLIGNDVSDARDGFYIQSSHHGTISHNQARDLRYGLHYMFSDDNTFTDNLFENGAAGAALMYSRRITFRRNRFVRNRGFASVGLLFKTCDDVVAEHNLIADNARGIFLEGSARIDLRANVIAGSDTAVVLYGSTVESRFAGNSFVANLSPLLLVGRRTDTRFDGNYWSAHDVLDLDGDGRADEPYRLSSVFDHFRANLTAADLLSQSVAATALAAAERAFPVLDPVPVVDRAPLAHPPRLPDVPVDRVGRRHADSLGLVAALGTLGAGIAGLRAGHKPLDAARRRRARRTSRDRV